MNNLRAGDGHYDSYSILYHLGILKIMHIYFIILLNIDAPL